MSRSMSFLKGSPRPAFLGFVAVLGVGLVGCGGQDEPVPPKGHSVRPTDHPAGRHPASATLAKARSVVDDAQQASGVFNRPWDPAWIPESAPPSYFDQFPTGTYRPHKPVAKSGPTVYQGYRFRPVEPDGREGAAPADGSERAYSGYGMVDGFGPEGTPWVGSGGFAQASPPRFRPLGDKDRERSRHAPGSPSGWPGSPTDSPLYPQPFLNQDAYGFEPAPW